MALNRIRPSTDSHFPDGGLDLVRDRDVGVQVGVPGAGVAVGERGRDEPGDVDLAHPSGAFAGVQGVLLDERQGVGDGLVVRLLDLRRDLGWGDRPQGADRLHRGEGQVVPGDRGRAGPGQLRDRTGQLPGVLGVAVVLGAEHLHGDLGADPGPVLRGDRVVAWVTQRGGEVLDPAGDLDLERGHIGGGDRERDPEPGHRLEVPILQVRPLQPLAALRGERVQPGTEQGLHLRRGDLVAGRQAVDAGHPGPHPVPGGLTALGVVAGQRRAGPAGAVVRSDLPGQVRVPGPGGELVQAHHTYLKPPGVPLAATWLRNQLPECMRCAVVEHFGFRGRDVSVRWRGAGVRGGGVWLARRAMTAVRSGFGARWPARGCQWA